MKLDTTRLAMREDANAIYRQAMSASGTPAWRDAEAALRDDTERVGWREIVAMRHVITKILADTTPPSPAT